MQMNMEYPTESLGLYEITFGSGAVQQRHLVYQHVFDEWYKHYQQYFYLSFTDDEEYGEHYRSLKKLGQKMFGDSHSYFTTESPVGLSLLYGISRIKNETMIFKLIE